MTYYKRNGPHFDIDGTTEISRAEFDQINAEFDGDISICVRNYGYRHDYHNKESGETTPAFVIWECYPNF